MAPWEKQFDVEHTLEKAMTAFWKNGYAGTSMQDLITCMGIHKGSIYATYGDKRSLFLAALRHYDAKFRKDRITRLERECLPLGAIRAFFQSLVDDAVGDKTRFGCFLTNTALECSAHDEEIAKIVSASQEDFEDFFRRMIKAGKSTGEISNTLSTRQMARALLGSLVGILVLSRSRPEKLLLQTIADEALQKLV